MNKTLINKIIEAIEYFDLKGSILRDAFARDIQGNKCLPFSEEAVDWDILGFFHRDIKDKKRGKVVSITAIEIWKDIDPLRTDIAIAIKRIWSERESWKDTIYQSSDSAEHSEIMLVLRETLGDLEVRHKEEGEAESVAIQAKNTRAKGKRKQLLTAVTDNEPRKRPKRKRQDLQRFLDTINTDDDPED